MLDFTERFGQWKPVSNPAGISWLVFYVLFLLYAALNAPNFLLIDFANLAIHEAGHPLFSAYVAAALKYRATSKRPGGSLSVVAA